MMNLIKKTAMAFLVASSLTAGHVAFAEDAKATEVIGHVEQAIVEAGKGDFNAANNHLKAARTASDQISGNEATVKKGYQSLVQAQIIAKSADTEKTIAELNKALNAYKSVQ